MSNLRDFESGLSPKDTLRFLSETPRGSERVFAEEGARLNLETAAHWRRLKNRYEHAARFPWIAAPESFKHPYWEDELERHPDGPW